jgi:hypothetical protein
MNLMNTEEAKVSVEDILYHYPDLTYSGFVVGGGPKRSLDERAAETLRDRQRMLTPYAIDQFLRSYDWLVRQPKTAKINRRAGTSYGLKEEVERESGYVSNGMFIAGAYASDYVVEQAGYNSQNACLNIGQLRASNPNLHVLMTHPEAARLIKQLGTPWSGSRRLVGVSRRGPLSGSVR